MKIEDKPLKRCTEWRGEHAAVFDHGVNFIDRLAQYEDTGLTPEQISAIRDQQEAEKNEPLTKEEMDWCRKNHKPVWIEVLCSRNKESGWALAGTRAAINQDVTVNVLWYEEYGTVWLAYRRPPKEAHNV